MSSTADEEKDSDSIGVGVEMLPTEAQGQKPAFEGQTRIAAISSNTAYRIDTVVKGLNRPWGLDFLPDGRMIITEKPGRIRIIDLDGNLGDSIGGVLPVHFQQDGGLMDVVIASDFAKSREIFWSFSERKDTGYVPSIARGRIAVDEKNLENVTVIYRTEPAIGSVMHYGTKLLIDGEGYLLATMGERYEQRVRVRAQALNSAFGKVIRIDRTGHGAPGNPFIGREDALAEIWAYGFRDPQGMAYHPENGELWLSEHGPRAGDEINVITAGKNYGWPMISYGLEYNKELVNGGLTQSENMEQPIYYWDPAVAPAGICIYSGKLIPELKNNLFVACLRGKHLIRLTLDGHKVTGEERLLVDWGQRIRAVCEGPDGALYLWNDEAEGCVIRIIPV
ncbi:MAG: PQQ-dependent sugar dehydrogenase [Saprospiraceae bacterium]|nr:PQQ-dependent sugar dehydrogenase [Saprospiraceae bacterium]